MAKALKVIGTVAVVAGLAIVTGGAAVGLGLSLATSVAGISAGALIAGGTLLSSIGSAMQKPPDTPSSMTDRLNANVDLRAFRKTVLGSTAMAADVRYVEWFGPDQERCGWIVAHASHSCESVDEIWLNDELAWTAAGGTQGRFAGYFFVRRVVLEGSAGNAFNFGSGRWNSFSSRLTGCCYSHWEFKVTGNGKKAESPFSNGIPTRVTVIGKGAKLYDPRRDSTVPGGSGAMRADDQTTWRYVADDGAVIGENLALQILRVLLGWRILGKIATGSGVPKRRIGLLSFCTAANQCDELVNRSTGGMEPRYHGAGVLSEGEDPRQQLDVLCVAASARFRDANGKLNIAILHNDLASAATDAGLVDDDVIGGFTWDPDPSLEQTPNVVRGKYTDPASLYQMVPYPDVRIPSLDGVDRAMAIDLAFVESPSQAQRIVKQLLQRRQNKRRFAAPFDITAWRYNVGDIVPFTFAPLGFNRRLFRVVETDPGANPCRMVLETETAANYAWDADDRAAVQPSEPIVYDSANNPIVRAIADAGETADWPRISGEGKPADYADVTADNTAKDTKALGGVPAIDVLGEIAVAQRDIDDLIATYGDTASSAASAAAALAAQNAAEAHEVNAELARDIAAGAAEGAAAQAGIAVSARADSEIFAGASHSSAQTATAQADLAGQRASAAETSRIAADTARGGSEAARSTAVQASDDAAGFATSAQSNASLSSAFAGQAAADASAAQGFATQADAASSSAASSANLTATYRDQAAGSADSAASSASASSSSAAAASASASTATAQQQLAAAHAGSSETSAGVSTSQAAIATAQASAAQSSAVLSARVSGGSINANSIFADYPGGGIPPGWASWAGNGGTRTYGNGDAAVDGPSIEGSPWGFRQSAAGNSDSAGIANDTPGSQGNYVVSATVQLRGGQGMGGAGVLVYGLDSAGAVVSAGFLHFATDADINGRVLGYSVSPGTEVFRFSKMIRLDGAGIAIVRIYAMTNYEGFAGSAAMRAKSLSWLRCGYRVASTAEVKTGQIDHLAATASQQAGVLAEHSNRLRAYLDTSVIAGTSRARIGMYAESSPGVRASGIELAADAVILGNNRTFTVQDERATVAGDLYIEGGNLIIRGATHMLVQGAGFGEVGEFIEWYGPIMPIGECNRTNGQTWKTRFGAQRISGFQTGLLVSGNGNPALGPNTSVNTGLIGSNGGAIQASASWSWRRTNVSNWAATNADRQAFIQYMQSLGATSDSTQNLWYFNGPVPAGGTTTLAIQKNGNTIDAVQSTTMLRDVFGYAPIQGDAGGQATVTETAHLAITYMDPERSTTSRHFGAVLARAASLTNPTEQVVGIATAE